MLEELSKYDSEWRIMALKICQDKMLADDLVGEMYLKVKDYNQVNHAFVYKVLKNTFLNHLRNEKRYRGEVTEHQKCQDCIFEPNDKEKEILEAFEKQKWHRQELLEDKIDLSYRQIEEKYSHTIGIHYAFAYREVKKAREEIFKIVNGNKNSRFVQAGQKN